TKTYVVNVGTGGTGGAHGCGNGQPLCAGTGGTHDILVEYAGSLPTTQANCQAMLGGAIFYRYDATTMSNVQIGSTQQANGLWLFQSCYMPSFVLTNYETYEIYGQPAGLRVAATMRDGSNHTQPVRI